MMTFLHGGGSLLLLVSMSLICAADPNQRCSTTDPLNFIKLAENSALPVRNTAGSLQPLYNFARLFLDAVQPNAFPKDIVQGAVDKEQLNISEVVRYEAGYVVCLILAILYLILMPVAGGILAWRHYHGNKEGSTRSSLSPSWHYWGITMATCLAAISILLLAGVILAFTTNNRVRENIKPNLYHLKSNLWDIGDALSSISQKMDVIVDEYSVPRANIENHLNSIGDEIGQAVIVSFDSEVKEALRDLSVSVQDAVGSRENLQSVHTLRSAMQTRQVLLQDELGKLKQGLRRIKVMCPQCSLPSINQLETDADYSKITSVQRQLSRFPPAEKYTNLVEQGNRSFIAIPQTCTTQTAPTVKALVKDLEETRASLNGSSQQFPSLQSFSEVVSDLGDSVNLYEEDINHYDYQRWAVAVLFCTVILLIVVLTGIGLSLGLLALYFPTSYPAHCEGHLENIAVALLRAGVVLTFIFSWLFIILVFVTLFFGGNMHTLGCRSWTSGELFKFFDQYDDLLSSLNVSQSNATMSQLNLSTAEVYAGCKAGQSLFNSRQLNELFDLEDFLNISKYMGGFRNNVVNMSISLEDMQLLSPQGRKNVLRFRDSGIDQINYAAFTILLSRPVVKTNLTAFAEQLDETAQTQNNETIRKELESQANQTREVNKLVQQQESDAKNMNRSAKALSAISVNFKANINKALSSIALTQEGLRQQVPFIVRNASQCMLQKGEECMRRYLNWVRSAIFNEVLECQWLAVLLDNVYTALCHNLVDPWNGFWLCLGWCCVFLIPGVIFSLFTARHLQPVSVLPSNKNAPVDPKEITQNTGHNNDANLTKKNCDLSS
ncbi:hypothetical protein AAFF_G00424310 [Aldrovandia affinis]|uniref:Prominin 2 n=1 Tax=Aldrovandia affinis TaxID=143900 RepID=A0AAD7WZH0_9TELE|nr:hypothetical protein AAFF_G00424310 [Aldrovandia affinis]